MLHSRCSVISKAKKPCFLLKNRKKEKNNDESCNRLLDCLISNYNESALLVDKTIMFVYFLFIVLYLLWTNEVDVKKFSDVEINNKQLMLEIIRNLILVLTVYVILATFHLGGVYLTIYKYISRHLLFDDNCHSVNYMLRFSSAMFFGQFTYSKHASFFNNFLSIVVFMIYILYILCPVAVCSVILNGLMDDKVKSMLDGGLPMTIMSICFIVLLIAWYYIFIIRWRSQMKNKK
jgi:hypothetical protein